MQSWFFVFQLVLFLLFAPEESVTLPESSLSPPERINVNKHSIKLISLNV